MTAKLRISEVYLSIQGEGPRVGTPTVFVRSAGCNLRCPGWPCDTPHAIDPAVFRLDAQLLTPSEVADKVEAIAPIGGNICFTGGEPFLQNHTAFYELVVDLEARGYNTFEVFTNGTLEFPVWAFEHLHFIMDWKLPGAGEEEVLSGAEGCESVRLENFKQLGEGDVVKFTIADEEDYEQAKEWYIFLSQQNLNVEFIYGVVWGKLEASQLIEWVLRDGLVEWTYSHQLHNVIWDRSKRGI